MRLGLLDIGSNTVHLLIVDAHYGAAPIPASKHKAHLRLAEHIGPDGVVDQGLVDELIAFIHDSQAFAEDMGVTELMAFATSAIREATNGVEVLAQVRAATGLSIGVLSGDEEARLTFLAVRRWFGWSSGRLLVMDIGGGSLELASGTDEEPDAEVSLGLGAGRMTREFLHSDPVRAEEMLALRRHARAAVGDVVGALRRVGEPRLVAATSKTFKQLARIAGAPPEAEGAYPRRILKYSDVRDLVTLLSSRTVAERTKLPGVSVGRAGQLLAGAIIAEAAMDLLSVEELAVCPWALREGVILRHLDGLPR
jgi:exopolyphosphatase/guanosine-5'-triphosphate,3'-diphosphate pyrophosphatase